MPAVRSAVRATTWMLRSPSSSRMSLMVRLVSAPGKAPIGVVRQVVRAPCPAERLHLLGVEAVSLARAFDEPDEVIAQSHALVKPHRHRVIAAVVQVPKRVDRPAGIDRHGGDPALSASQRKLVGEVAALGGLLERLLRRRWVATPRETNRGARAICLPCSGAPFKSGAPTPRKFIWARDGASFERSWYRELTEGSRLSEYRFRKPRSVPMCNFRTVSWSLR